jgi:hypothetical protein
MAREHYAFILIAGVKYWNKLWDETKPAENPVFS